MGEKFTFRVNTCTVRTYIGIITNFFAFAVLFIFSGNTPVFSQTVDVPRETTITAVVADHIPPSTPILISPEDDSKLDSGLVEFVWQGSTDNWLMGHYQLVINDEIFFDTIPLTNTSNSDYDLTYDSGTGYYTLTIKDDLGDGNYEWSITAVDYHGNETSSVTWKFSIDTKAPDFTITTIEDQEFEISTNDAQSVPTDPIVLQENEPILSGTGEANSIVHLTINYLDGTQEEITFTIGGDGTWSITLGILPRDEKILLNFLITDTFGNVSILSDVPLILYSPTVTIPVPPIIDDLPFTPIPDDDSSITIPILPPIEYLPPPLRDLPVRFEKFVTSVATEIREDAITTLMKLLNFVLLLLLLALPLLKLGLLSYWYRYYLSGQLFKQFLWLIGWWHEQKPQGIVVNRSDQTAVDYSLVLVSGKSSDYKNSTSSFITNQYGIFPDFKLPEGEYRISIHHPQYFFPTLEKRPEHLDWNSFYTGASFGVKNGVTLPPLVLPVEPLEKQLLAWPQEARRAILRAPAVSVILMFISIGISLFVPSFINLVTLAIYSVLFVRKRLRHIQAKTEVSVTTENKQPVPNAIVSFQQEGASNLSTLFQTDAEGLGTWRGSPGLYSAWIIDFKHSLVEGDNKTMTSIKTDASKNYLPFIVVNK